MNIGLMLGLYPANERRHYNVSASLWLGANLEPALKHIGLKIWRNLQTNQAFMIRFPRTNIYRCNMSSHSFYNCFSGIGETTWLTSILSGMLLIPNQLLIFRQRFLGGNCTELARSQTLWKIMRKCRLYVQLKLLNTNMLNSPFPSVL